MIYGLGRTHNAHGTEAGLTILRENHRYSFPGRHRPAEFARLLLLDLDELNAPTP